jgi:hypothetical protein
MNKIYRIVSLATCGMTVTLRAQNLYVVNAGSSTIGEYGLDGATVNASLISKLSGAWDVAISDDDLFISDNTFGLIANTRHLAPQSTPR